MKLWHKWNGIFSHPKISWIFANDSEQDPILANPSAETKGTTPDIEKRKQYHDEITQRMRQLAGWTVGVCLFCMLTVFGSSDGEILYGGGSVTLPVISYTIGLSSFLILSPIGLVTLVIYLHLFVGEHRRYHLPAPSARPMVANFPNPVAQFISALLFYGLVPVTLGVFVWKMWPWPMGEFLLYAFVTTTAGLLFLLAHRAHARHRGWLLPTVGFSIAFIWVGGAEVLSQRQLDLRESQLEGADLEGQDLSNIRLQDAELSGAVLNGANFEGAQLAGADLSDISAIGLRATRAVFAEADLRNANMVSAKLQRTNFLRADLEGANLQLASFDNTNLKEANLRDADLRRVSGLLCLDLWQAKNWQKAVRSENLECGGDLPKPTRRSPLE